MNGFASITVMGNMTRDPEVRAVGQDSVTSFAIAVNKSWKNKDGEKQEKVAFIDCSAWGKTGEVIAQFFTKGKPIVVQGEVEQDNWETDAGEKRSKLKVRVDRFHFVPDGKKEDGDSEKSTPAAKPAAKPAPKAASKPKTVPHGDGAISEDDIPF